jgi:hypothetical protein
MLAQQLASAMPELLTVSVETPAQLDDKGGGLLERERKVAEFDCERPSGSFVACVVALFGNPILEVTGRIVRW